jgi:beta-glucanase (GH16 family)
MTKYPITEKSVAKIFAGLRLIRFLPVVIFAALAISAVPVWGQFYDDFQGTKLDTNKWLIMEKAWGPGNRGVVHDNVVVSNGLLHLIGHGNLYNGPVHGVDKKGQRVDEVTRVGAVIATVNYFASGKYEVCMKLPPHLGSCSAIWTFHYEEAYSDNPQYAALSRLGGLTVSNLLWYGLKQDQIGALLADLTGNKGARPPYLTGPTNGVYFTTDYFRNHVLYVNQMDLARDFGKKLKIFVALANAASLRPQGSDESGNYVVRNPEVDIETPTGLKTALDDISYGHARMNTWVGENDAEFTDNFDDLGHAMNDGRFHVYRFDWHTTGSAPLKQRVEFYVDGKCYQTNYTHIPTIGGRFNLGQWFPTWAGDADFDTQELDVKWVRITPFNENGDQSVPETYPNDGWWGPGTAANQP